MNDTIECLVCNTVFSPKSTRAKFCSEACKQRNKREKIGVPENRVVAEKIILPEEETYEDYLSRRMIETISTKSNTTLVHFQGKDHPIQIPHKWESRDIDRACFEIRGVWPE